MAHGIRSMGCLALVLGQSDCGLPPQISLMRVIGVLLAGSFFWIENGNDEDIMYSRTKSVCGGVERRESSRCAHCKMSIYKAAKRNQILRIVNRYHDNNNQRYFQENQFSPEYAPRERE